MDCNNTVMKKEASTTTEAAEVEHKQINSEHVKKHTKEEKARKKDDKSIEQVLKALNSLETTEEKLAAMCKKYSDILEENRKLQLAAKQAEKRMSVLQREKEQLQTEHSKAVLTRSRLESLCRELQRQNKAIKDESLLKIREEEEKRKDVSAKFQSTLNEITALMQQNNEKNSKLREDNIEMTKKFKTVCEQYEIREQQVEKITKQMKLEAQLADAKLAKAKMEMAAEKEILLKEKQQLLLDLTEYQAKCRELQATEVNLRSQISLYTDKYDEFQNALSRSNEVFGGFKGEMEKMSKKICKLEKETTSWKQRWEKSHQALLEMAADKQQRDNDLALATRQLAQLQKLCRTLQAERTLLLAQLKNEGISKPAVASSGDAAVEAPPLIKETVPDSCCLHTYAESCKQENPTAPVPKTKKGHKKTMHTNEQKPGEEKVTPCRQEKSLPSCTQLSEEHKNTQSNLSDTPEELLTEIIPKLQTLTTEEKPLASDSKSETKISETQLAKTDEQNLQSNSSGMDEIKVELVTEQEITKINESPMNATETETTESPSEISRVNNEPEIACNSSQPKLDVINTEQCSGILNNTVEGSFIKDVTTNENVEGQTPEVSTDRLPENKDVGFNNEEEIKTEPALRGTDISETSMNKSCEITNAVSNIECAENVSQTEQHPCLESPATEEVKSSPITPDSCGDTFSTATTDALVNERLSGDCQITNPTELVDNVISLTTLTDLINAQNAALDQLNNPVATADSENNIITNQTVNESEVVMKTPPAEGNQTANKAAKAGSSDSKRGRDGGKKRKNK